jgi:hypothetical protein
MPAVRGEEILWFKRFFNVKTVKGAFVNFGPKDLTFFLSTAIFKLEKIKRSKRIEDAGEGSDRSDQRAAQ